ncbi:MAG: tRNA 5-methoxyuridine(34)/uridine 5-oxyacetic acid(34) synthase CmoB [Bdellovibrionales bacterium]|nr:tRNA 5-methoxyuridine(34)/uridine 5-oxyacetic acid(34) synthase CmoB [Bdellovibrionales bacterium]
MPFICDNPRQFIHSIRYDEYLKVHRSQVQELISIEFWNRHRDLLNALQDKFIEQSGFKMRLGDAVAIECADPTPEGLELVTRAVESLIPWRKGPFEICGLPIDAEWRSDLKWKRVVGLLKSRAVGRLADIGCNNGYYMYRALELDPELVVGFDPNARFYYQFDLIQRFLRIPNLYFEPLGIDDVDLFPNFFDTVICMGVIYHRRDPHLAVQKIYECMKPGGYLLFESLAIPGEGAICLLPSDRYAKMKNVWFVPSAEGMQALLEKNGFIDVKIESVDKVTEIEQRKTKYAPFESLKDYLDQNDASKTVEGYPAPLRVLCSAVKQAD